jgi:hypothetical protein
LCNEIGVNAITLPANAAQAASLQRQLLDFVRRSEADAMTQAPKKWRRHIERTKILRTCVETDEAMLRNERGRELVSSLPLERPLQLMDVAHE